MQSQDFYANLQTGFVGRFKNKVGRFERTSCALCFKLGNTFPFEKMLKLGTLSAMVRGGVTISILSAF